MERIQHAPPRPWFALALALTAGFAAAGLGGALGAAVLAAVAFGAAFRGATGWALVAVIAFAGRVDTVVAEPGLRPGEPHMWTYGEASIGPWRVFPRTARRQLGPGYSVQGAADLARVGERVGWLPGTPGKRYVTTDSPGTAEQPVEELPARLMLESQALVRLAPRERSLLGSLWARALGSAPTLAPPLGLRTRLLVEAARLELAAGLPPGLGQALWLGESGGLEPGVRDLFTRTGTRHLLAISGMHVGILAALLLWPLSRRAGVLLSALLQTVERWLGRHLPLGPLRRSGASSRLIFAATLFGFASLAGGAAPVWRAAVVVALGVGAGAIGRLGRRIDPLNLWGAALCFEWLVGSRAPDDLGLQLSYASALGLILFVVPVSRALAVRLKGWTRWLPGMETWRPAWARGTWTVLVSGSIRVASLTTAASLVAVAATLPWTWHYFGEWAPAGLLLTGLCLLPLTALLVLGWPLLATAAALPTSALLDALAPWLLGAPAKLLGEALVLGDGLPGTPWFLPARPAWSIALPLLLLALGRSYTPRAKKARRDRYRHGMQAATLFASAAVLLPWSPAPASVEVRVLPIGHGTAVLLRTPDDQVWVFDAGSRDRLGVFDRGLAPRLAQWEASAVNVILSHADLDHWSALPELTQRLEIESWHGYLPPELELPPNVPRTDLDAGATDILTGRVGLTLMRGSATPGNEGSRSLFVSAEGTGILLSGDAEAEGLEGLLDAWEAQSPVDVLLWPHHGSFTPHLEPLLARLAPREAWISKGGTAQLEAELARRGVSTRTTERHGELVWSPLARTTEPAGIRNPERHAPYHGDLVRRPSPAPTSR